MVLLTATPQIISTISSLPPSAIAILTATLPPSKDNSTTTTTTTTTKDVNEPTDPTPSLPISPTSPISHHTLLALLALRYKNPTLNIPPLNTLLHGTRPYKTPTPPKPIPSASYTALMTRLRNEQESREYAAMLSQRSQRSTITGSEDEDQDNISPSFVFNVLLSVVMCAVAMFQVTKWLAGDGVRVLVSLATGVVVGVAEVGVYSIYLLKVRRAKEKERKVVERKVVIGEYVPEEESGTRVVSEKEEIWGRGVNGGMRRRVREKWEKGEEKGKEMDENKVEM